jgi:hypothetical protein
MENRVYVGLSTLLLIAIACRPVIAIGWGEALLLGVLFLFLLGPPLYRLIQRIEDFRKHERKHK